MFIETTESDLTELKVTYNVGIELTCYHRHLPDFVVFLPKATLPLFLVLLRQRAVGCFPHSSRADCFIIGNSRAFHRNHILGFLCSSN